MLVVKRHSHLQEKGTPYEMGPFEGGGEMRTVLNNLKQLQYYIKPMETSQTPCGGKLC
jgi:hypothetical protein